MFDAELLKNMAATAVSRFVAQGVPLNDSITKLAMENDLNPQQTLRLVELSNQVAYLKLQESATDRTFTFPLADPSLVKAASLVPEFPEYSSLLEDTLSILQGGSALTKQAEVPLPTPESFDPGEVVKYASTARSVQDLLDARTRYQAEVDSLSTRMPGIGEAIVKKAHAMAGDEWIMEKISAYQGPGAEILPGLFPEGLMKKAHVLPRGMFSPAEMKDVIALGALVKEAQDASARMKFLREELEKIAKVDLRLALLKTPFEHAHVAVHHVPSRMAGAQAKNSVRGSYMGAKGDAEAGVKIGPVQTEGRAQPLLKKAEAFHTPSVSMRDRYSKSLIGTLTGAKSTAQLQEEKAMGKKVPGIASKALSAMDVGFGAQMIQPSNSVWDALHKTPEA
jgi:hypothetical protein